MEDNSGELWIGTNGGGVARLDRTRRSFSAYVADPNDPSSLPNGKILVVLVDKYKRLWVSIYSNGVHMLDPKNRHVDSLSAFREGSREPRRRYLQLHV